MPVFFNAFLPDQFQVLVPMLEVQYHQASPLPTFSSCLSSELAPQVLVPERLQVAGLLVFLPFAFLFERRQRSEG